MAELYTELAYYPLETYEDHVSRAIVDYSVSTTSTNVTIEIHNVRVTEHAGSYAAAFTGTVTVSLDSTTVLSWKLTSARNEVKTIQYSKTITRTHSSSVSRLEIAMQGMVNQAASDSSSRDVAILIQARPSYAVTYDANEGSNAPSNQTKWHDESLTLSGSKPTRSGYQFWHWNTSSTNSGTSWVPNETYGGNSALHLYAIWNPIITYNANGGSGTPQSQTKTYNVSINLSSTRPQRTGYEFLGWSASKTATTASYQPSQTYTSNNSLALYAVWRKAAAPPTISSMKTIRCDSDGRADDSGEFCKVTATWSVDTSGAGMASNYGRVIGTITKYGGTPTTFNITSGAGGIGVTNDTALAIIPNCDTDSQYVIAITVINNVMGTGQSTYLSTRRSDILTRAFFTLDFAAGGKGIGMGVAAPTEGFECGFTARFNNEVRIIGPLVSPVTTLGYTDTISEIITTSSSAPFTIEAITVYRYGYLAKINIVLTPTRDIQHEKVSIGTLNSGFGALGKQTTATMMYTTSVSFLWIDSRSVSLYNNDATLKSGTQFSISGIYFLQDPYSATIS